MSQPDYVVYPNGRRELAVILSCLAFVLMFALILTWESSTLNVVVARTGIVFFGGGGIVLLLRALPRRPMLELTSMGIENRSSIVQAGVVSWEDIAGFHLYVLQPPVWGARPQRFLAIDLRDTAGYKSQISWSHPGMARISDAMGTPKVAIPLNHASSRRVAAAPVGDQKALGRADCA